MSKLQLGLYTRLPQQILMNPPNIECARAMRDGGIDAMAALNDALGEAIKGLAPQQAHELKLAFGSIMGDIAEKIVNPAVESFPQLAPDEETWISIARARAAARCNEL